MSNSDAPGEITRLLEAVQSGDRAAESQLLELVYPEIHKLARRYLQRERPDHTLQASALVNEVYMQLLGGVSIDWRNRVHFFAATAQSIRRILVDYGRSKRAAKREGDRHRVELMDFLAISEDRLEEAVAVHEALERLAEFDPRQSRIVELKHFGGLTDEEIGELLGVAPRTVSREWMVARAWLHAELNG
ncbi:MAG TPA: sigma-70 family RNA polymerase sigma factor [Bryobacteraceae bacterium]|jgi:RNA polymerase sigma factor (TIGR02999 family)|nr:sigma-70 family RNA polymerase sigma factor [Bryobacteraceae bacterium]